MQALEDSRHSCKIHLQDWLILAPSPSEGDSYLLFSLSDFLTFSQILIATSPAALCGKVFKKLLPVKNAAISDLNLNLNLMEI